MVDSWRELAKRGGHIVPLHGKQPLVKAWQSTPLAFDADPPPGTDNYGLIPATLGLVVIDVDRADAIPARLRREIDRLGEGATTIVKSPNGFHVYLKWRWPNNSPGVRHWTVGDVRGEIRHSNGQCRLYDVAGILAFLDSGTDAPDGVRHLVEGLAMPRVGTGERNAELNKRAFRNPGTKEAIAVAGRLDGLSPSEVAATVDSGATAGAEHADSLENADDTGLAVAFRNHMAGKVRYATDTQRFYLFADGAGWREVPANSAQVEGAYQTACYEWHRAGAFDRRALKQIASRARASAVVTALKSRTGVPCLSTDWNRDPELAGLPDGRILNVVAGGIRRADVATMVSRRLAVVPRDGPAPLWQGVLDYALDPECQEWLRAWFKYSLTGLVDHRLTLFIYGGSTTGKGTVVRVLGDIAGRGRDGYCGVVMEDMLTLGADRHASWQGAFVETRAVICNEVKQGSRINAAFLKAIASGDPMIYERKGVDGVDVDPTGKLTVALNSRPSFAGDTTGVFERLRVLPMDREVERPDPTLKTRLRAEYPLILSWALGGDLALLAPGEALPEAMSVAGADYLAVERELQTAFWELFDAASDGQVDFVIVRTKLEAAGVVDARLSDKALRARLREELRIDTSARRKVTADEAANSSGHYEAGDKVSVVRGIAIRDAAPQSDIPF